MKQIHNEQEFNTAIQNDKSVSSYLRPNGVVTACLSNHLCQVSKQHMMPMIFYEIDRDEMMDLAQELGNHGNPKLCQL